MKELVDRLAQTRRLDSEGYHTLLNGCDDQTLAYLREKAVRTACKQFGHNIYIRGLIEISSYCRNDCLYCGLRRSNSHAERYRLTDSQILDCCLKGYAAGVRTFVLQGGEDPVFNDERLVQLIRQIKEDFPGVAVTLSLGERTEESYLRLKEAGADRYLLRHEAADRSLYESIHPVGMSWQHRLDCVLSLKRAGFQTGTGMMIGVPGQSVDSLVEDLVFMEGVEPEMIGIGPFIPHKDTPLGTYPAGSLDRTLMMTAIIRLMFPKALIPATTALSTLSPDGHRQGILSGANIIMPNLSPIEVRDCYSIYDGKANRGCEAVEGLRLLEDELKTIGYRIDYSKGDHHDHI